MPPARPQELLAAIVSAFYATYGGSSDERMPPSNAGGTDCLVFGDSMRQPLLPTPQITGVDPPTKSQWAVVSEILLRIAKVAGKDGTATERFVKSNPRSLERGTYTLAFLQSIDARKDLTAAEVFLNDFESKLLQIGCQPRDVESYLRQSNQCLASLYLEARQPQPSPGKLRQLALQFAWDAQLRFPVRSSVSK